MFATPAYAQTAPASVPAGGPGGAPPSSPMDFLTGGPLPLLILMFGAMYLLIIRPQQQRAKKHQTMVAALKRGDTVVMSSGVIGKVVRVEDAELQVEIAPNTVVKVVKSMVNEVRARGEPAAANDGKLIAPKK